jgi:hypothetical protein
VGSNPAVYWMDVTEVFYISITMKRKRLKLVGHLKNSIITFPTKILVWIGSKIPSESTNSSHKLLSSSDKNCLRPNGPEAGATFDNSFFDNSFLG